MIQRQRVPFLLMALVSLIAGLWAGLVRVGWSLPAAERAPLLAHGPLMVVAFVGTVIGLERAVALGKKWAYAAPLLTGLGGIALLAAPWPALGPALMTAGSAGFLAVMVTLARRQPGAIMLIMGTGAACWVAGNALWASGWPVYRVVLWWAVFPVLTIVAERLELSRFARISKTAMTMLYAAVALSVAGLVIGRPVPEVGTRMVAVSWVFMALWLLQYDAARRKLRDAGLPRFVAVGLFAGYLWMLVAGVVLLWAGPVTSGYAYDAAFHSIFVGFVFSMIFVHAPIIFPSVTGVDIPFRGVFYGHLGLLHAALLLRVAGDARVWLPWRQWGAMLNAVAVVMFFAVTALTAIAGVIADRRTP